MKGRQKVIELKFDETIIEITGIYYPGYHGDWDEQPESEYFEIENIELVEGSLIGLISELNGRKDSYDYLENECLKRIE